jgi:hypothetical protein
MELDDLDPRTRGALGEYVARIKHDLGKYVAFRIRWVGSDAPLGERREAVAADLLSTRRGPEGERDAASLWREFRRALVGEEALPDGSRVDLSADPAVVEIDLALQRIAAITAALRDLSADEDRVRQGADAAFAIARACSDLHRRVRG